MERRMLEGKVAIITGASYGMGRTVAELSAEEGASVVLTARGRDKLDAVIEGIRAKGGRAIDQAYACLYLASKIGRAVRGQVLQVCNGAFL